MDQQRRCLTGMLTGLPLAVPAPGAGVLVHTLDQSQAGDTSGRPYLDQMSLFLANGGAGAATCDVTFTPLVGAPITVTVTVQPGETARVFDETVFGGSLSAPGGAAIAVSVQAGGPATGVSTWGWFVRTQG